MSTLTAEELEAYLTDYGWYFHTVGKNAWSTGFQGDQRVYPMTIRLSATCVSFEIRPLLDLDLDLRRTPTLVREFLELNHKLQMVKLTLTESGELSMACQLLTLGFDFEILACILGILAYYADEIAVEIHARIQQAGRKQGRETKFLC